MPYHAEKRVQMRRLGDKTSTLEFHELGPDGKEPLCGPKPREWQGYTMRPMTEGPGPVTCTACAKIRGHST